VQHKYRKRLQNAIRLETVSIADSLQNRQHAVRTHQLREGNGEKRNEGMKKEKREEDQNRWRIRRKRNGMGREGRRTIGQGKGHKKKGRE